MILDQCYRDCPNCETECLCDEYECGCIIGKCNNCNTDFEFTNDCLDNKKTEENK